MRSLNIAARWPYAVLALIAALVVAACGGDDSSGGEESASTPAATTASGGSTEVETLKFAMYPSTDYAALMVGVDQGIFEKHGIKLEIEQVLTGTALTSAITSGDFDIATNSPTSMATAIGNGLKVKMITPVDKIPTEGYVEALVKADSGIDSFADLAGKTAATVNLQGAFDMGTRAAVTADGGDQAKLKTIAMSPADEPAALAAGRLDAIVLQDPFLATGKKNKDFKSIGNPFAKLSYPVYVGAVWSSDDTIAKKAAAFARFREAMVEVSGIVQDDPDLAYKIIPTYTELSEDDARALTLPIYDADITSDELTPMLDTMKGYGWIKGELGFDDIVWSGS